MIEYVPYLFPFFFVGMWIVVTFAISQFAWARLAKKYKLQESIKGRRIGFISASINSANYNNAIVLYSSEEGITLKAVLLFRLFHPTLFIPWSEISDVQERKILFFKFNELVIGNPFIAVIKLRNKTFKEIEEDYVFYKKNEIVGK